MGLKAVKSAGTPATEPTKAEKAEKVEAAAQATAQTVSSDKLCSKSNLVALVAPLGDPSHPDTTITESGEKKVTSYIVGYRFKALADLEVPECGLGDDARTNLMSFKDKNGRRMVKAGETFDLTRFETGMLLAPPEFNGRISGEGKNFYATFQTGTIKTKNGQVAQTTQTNDIPTVSLKPDGKGSIKDMKIIDVLTSKNVQGNGGVVRKERAIIKGFEKWAPLCLEKTRMSSGGSGSSAPANTRNAKAEAFLAIVSKK